MDEMNDNSRANHLLEKLEEIFAKLENRSLKTDAWEGKDNEVKEPSLIKLPSSRGTTNPSKPVL